MRLTDISLNWLLPGAVLLLGMLAAVAVLARNKRSGENANADDSWERSEDRRRRKEAVYGTASYALLFSVRRSPPRSPFTAWSASAGRT